MYLEQIEHALNDLVDTNPKVTPSLSLLVAVAEYLLCDDPEACDCEMQMKDTLEARLQLEYNAHMLEGLGKSGYVSVREFCEKNAFISPSTVRSMFSSGEDERVYEFLKKVGGRIYVHSEKALRYLCAKSVYRNRIDRGVPSCYQTCQFEEVCKPTQCSITFKP